jgi:hypothetical protein
VEVGRVELHLSRLIGMVSYLDMQKIQMIGFFFEKRLHWWFEVEEYFYKWLFCATYLFTYKLTHWNTAGCETTEPSMPLLLILAFCR